MALHDSCLSLRTLQFLTDPDLTVRQSCEVALDAADYFGLIPCSIGGEEEAAPDAGVFSFTSVKGTTKSHLNIKEKTCAA